MVRHVPWFCFCSCTVWSLYCCDSSELAVLYLDTLTCFTFQNWLHSCRIVTHDEVLSSQVCLWGANERSTAWARCRGHPDHPGFIATSVWQILSFQFTLCAAFGLHCLHIPAWLAHVFPLASLRITGGFFTIWDLCECIQVFFWTPSDGCNTMRQFCPG